MRHNINAIWQSPHLEFTEWAKSCEHTVPDIIKGFISRLFLYPLLRSFLLAL